MWSKFSLIILALVALGEPKQGLGSNEWDSPDSFDNIESMVFNGPNNGFPNMVSPPASMEDVLNVTGPAQFLKEALENMDKMRHLDILLAQLNHVQGKWRTNRDFNLEHIDGETESVILDILRLDAQNGNVLKSYQEGVSLSSFNTRGSSKAKLDPKLVGLLATITPILGDISKECRSESFFYLRSLFKLKLWALLMVDSVGKLPDGMLADTTDLCDILPCGFFQLDFLIGKLPIPRGNTYGIGSFEGCLKVEGIDSEKGISTRGRFSPLLLAPKPKGNESDRAFPTPGLVSKNFLKDEAEGRFGVAPAMIGQIIDQIGLDVSTVQGVVDLIVILMYLRWGQCSPSACGPEDIRKNFEELYRPLGLTVKVLNSVTEETKRPEFDALSISILVIFSIMAALLFIGTAVEVWQLCDPLKGRYLAKDHQGKDSKVAEILKCFSIYKNGCKVLDSTVAAQDHFACLEGIRVLSICWVFAAHMYGFSLLLPLRNPLEHFGRINGRSGVFYEVFVNAYPSVDTFFLMSGMLVAYGFFKQVQSGRFNLVVFYVHRYVRLVIPMLFALLFVMGVIKYVWFGPHYNIISEYAETCISNGWANLLFINNFIYEGECLGVTWYLANDVQFYLLSPLLLFPIWWNFKVGMVLWSALMVTVTGTTAYLVNVYHIPPTATFFVNDLQDNYDVFGDFYVKPYVRGQPFLIGILLGYVLFRLRGKEVQIPHALNLVLWQLSLLVMLAVVFGVGDAKAQTSSGDLGYTMLSSTMYNCFYRIAWSLALSWIIFSCVKGYGGIINSFLSWGLFVPLARMSYFFYLIHLDFLQVFIRSLTYTVELTDFIFATYFFGLIVITCGLSFVATLAFESPFVRLEKMVLTALMGKTSQGDKNPQSLVTQGQDEGDGSYVNRGLDQSHVETQPGTKTEAAYPQVTMKASEHTCNDLYEAADELDEDTIYHTERTSIRDNGIVPEAPRDTPNGSSSYPLEPPPSYNQIPGRVLVCSADVHSSSTSSSEHGH